MNPYLRPFQQRVFNRLTQQQNVILQAPTGAGKTRAAIAAFVQKLAAKLAVDFPSRCIYAVPTRVLTEQFFIEYADLAQRVDRNYDQKLHQQFAEFHREPITKQTGDQPNDPHFEAALTFCTIDQLLASFLGIPYGIGSKNANINPSAVISSYLVLDEFHLYPVDREHQQSFGARTTALRMLQLLQHRQIQLSPFTLMTATFSSQLIQELATILNASIVSVLPEVDSEAESDELDQLNANRQRIYDIQAQPLTADSVLAFHETLSLVICNTVKRAQQIYLELQESTKGSVELLLLHSRFTDVDRASKQQLIASKTGKEAWINGLASQQNLIIVTTQVIEVGVDISVLHLHSEIAPANSLIQRAGRCARFPGQKGFVHIYPIAHDVQASAYLPYDREECLKTLDACQNYQHQHVGFLQEQSLIDAVHTENDLQLLELYAQNRDRIDKSIASGWAKAERGISSQLIRNVTQVNFVIHDNPNSALTTNPWEYQTFGMRPASLIGIWKKLENTVEQGPQAADWLEHDDQNIIGYTAKLLDVEQSLEDERIEPRYTWQAISNHNEITTSIVLAFPRRYVQYNSEIGIIFRDGSFPQLEAVWNSIFQSDLRVSQRKQFNIIEYQQESYFEHIHGLYRAYQSRLIDEIQYAAKKLEQIMRLPHGLIDRAIRLAIACHDLGKLGEGWQEFAKKWQHLLITTYPKKYETYTPQKYPFAHTDSEKEHRPLRNLIAKPPPHACESAFLAHTFIESSLGFYEDEDPQIAKLARATVAAIARHHASFSQEYQAIDLIKEAQTTLNDVLALVSQGQAWQFELDLLIETIPFSGSLTSQQMTTIAADATLQTNLHEAFCYFLIVRILRLCDWRSFFYTHKH
ncbi:CRISPR-associated helicase Cas3' [Herpetosiphon llansteffanensis]|uniref:CRISPR-associated helicase Cas3' n=1 Tax=Herpetosiphon llansteffanensis TaxID=2094568 RepID=UPI000D7CF701|nr:CRISPR-associated helicase Cas3' [Herpetosiphon llansteffanensis]